jgi:hypothetical protein
MKSRAPPWRSPIRSPDPEALFRKRVIAPLTAVKAGTLLQANIGAKSSCILEVRARLVAPRTKDHVMTMGPTRSRADAGQFSSNSVSAALAENWWAVAIRGLLGILFGAIAFIFPGATIRSLVLVFSAYVIVDGIFAIVSAVRAARQHERWWTLALAGVAHDQD